MINISEKDMGPQPHQIEVTKTIRKNGFKACYNDYPDNYYVNVILGNAVNSYVFRDITISLIPKYADKKYVRMDQNLIEGNFVNTEWNMYFQPNEIRISEDEKLPWYEKVEIKKNFLRPDKSEYVMNWDNVFERVQERLDTIDKNLSELVLKFLEELSMKNVEELSSSIMKVNGIQ